MVGFPASRPGWKIMVMTGHNSTQPTELFLWKGKGEAQHLILHNGYLRVHPSQSQKIHRALKMAVLDLSEKIGLLIGE